MESGFLRKSVGFLSVCVSLLCLPLSALAASVPAPMHSGSASWYRYQHCNCTASPDYPKGTYLLVSRVDNPKRSVVVRVNDFGPVRRVFPHRVVDLDLVAFQAIGSKRDGVIQVTVDPLAPGDPRIPKTSSTSRS